MKLRNYLNTIHTSKLKADFFDVRVEYTRSSQIQFTNGEATGCYERPSFGAFIRVFNRGRWYFTSTTRVDHLNDELANLISSSHKLPIGDENFEAPQAYPQFVKASPT